MASLCTVCGGLILPGQILDHMLSCQGSHPDMYQIPVKPIYTIRTCDVCGKTLPDAEEARRHINGCHAKLKQYWGWVDQVYQSMDKHGVYLFILADHTVKAYTADEFKKEFNDNWQAYQGKPFRVLQVAFGESVNRPPFVAAWAGISVSGSLKFNQTQAIPC